MRLEPTVVAIVLLAAACRSGDAQDREQPPIGGATAVSSAPVAPSASHAAATPSAPADLLRCRLDVNAVELGDAGDGVPSAPARFGLVRRHPRAAAVGKGWALSYWDGTGASLVRIDKAGNVTANPIELRSGDERGGHVDARMAANDEAIAVTWQVKPPPMGHGHPDEKPRRRGPRIAILRCAQ